MDGLNQALHWVYENKKDEDVVFNFEMDEADYVNALEFINEYAIPYSKVCDAYVAYSRNRFTGEVDGKDIFFKHMKLKHNGIIPMNSLVNRHFWMD